MIYACCKFLEPCKWDFYIYIIMMTFRQDIFLKVMYFANNTLKVNM